MVKATPCCLNKQAVVLCEALGSEDTKLDLLGSSASDVGGLTCLAETDAGAPGAAREVVFGQRHV